MAQLPDDLPMHGRQRHHTAVRDSPHPRWIEHPQRDLGVGLKAHLCRHSGSSAHACGKYHHTAAGQLACGSVEQQVSAI